MDKKSLTCKLFSLFMKWQCFVKCEQTFFLHKHVSVYCKTCGEAILKAFFFSYGNFPTCEPQIFTCSLWCCHEYVAIYFSYLTFLPMGGKTWASCIFTIHHDFELMFAWAVLQNLLGIRKTSCCLREVAPFFCKQPPASSLWLNCIRGKIWPHLHPLGKKKTLSRLVGEKWGRTHNKVSLWSHCSTLKVFFFWFYFSSRHKKA